jgi:uncharacterized membrane protein YjgN (DUF898 family)
MQPDTQQFEFHGKTDEFFKIWIVNILLSIVTLGIYSAWAKVRTRRYFYSNTLLMNAPFDYLADPVKILKGRLLVFAVVVVYIIIATLYPGAETVFFLIFIPLFPWIIIKALKFNWFNSAYRNIRFHFRGEYFNALWVFVGLPILTALSFGLAYPYFTKARKQFVIDNSTYGTARFELSAGTGQFYSVYLKAMLAISASFLVLAGIVYALWQTLWMQDNVFDPIIAILAFFLIYPILMVVYGYVYTQITNLVINHTSLHTVHFESHLETAKLCWLYFSNALAILASFGLLIPWAMIRTARYRITCLSLTASADLDGFIAAEAERADAIGEEIGDFLDIDIGL